MTPSIGLRTGIGQVVAHMYDCLEESNSIILEPYALSYKARAYANDLPENTHFITVPARALLNTWKYSNWPSLKNQLGEIDLVHATNYLAPPAINNVPLLITLHDATMVKFPELVSPKVKSLIPIIKKRLRAGAHVHVPTAAIKSDIEEHFSDDIEDASKIHIVPFGTPTITESEPSEPIKKLVNADPYILSIGMLEPRKNHARLIEAFEAVYEKNKHIRLFLVGPDGPARPQIDEALSKLSHNARSRISITGPVSDKDRSYLLKKATLLAYPSIYEGFGLPVLEAMSTKTAIVSSKEGSLEEVSGDASEFVDAYSSEDIARGINLVLEDDKLREKLINNGEKQFLEKDPFFGGIKNKFFEGNEKGSHNNMIDRALNMDLFINNPIN